MRRLLFRTCSLPMIAFAALALFAAPDRANGTQAEALGESFHADQYPSRRAAIADLAKQVADELKSRPKTPAQIDLLTGGGADDATRQQFTAALERELPDSECTARDESSSEPTTAPSGSQAARVKLRAGETTPIVAPWSTKEHHLLSGSFTAFVVASGTRATVTSRFTEKPWADDWAGFVNANSSHRWLTAQSQSPCTSEAEATESARRAAVDDLAKL